MADQRKPGQAGRPASLYRTRQMAKAIMLEIATLQDSMLKALPGVERATGEDDAFGEVWAGLCQARASADLAFAASDYQLERLVRAATGRVRTMVPATNIDDDAEFEMSVFGKVSRPSVQTIADELGWSEEEVRRKVGLHPLMQISDGDKIDCETERA